MKSIIHKNSIYMNDKMCFTSSEWDKAEQKIW